MKRREFFRRSAIIAAGVVAADQMEILERLAWEPKRLWAGADFERRIPLTLTHGYSYARIIEDGGYEAVTISPSPGFVYIQQGFPS